MEKTKELGLLMVNSTYWHWLPGMLLISEDGLKERVVKIRRKDGWVYLASENEGGFVGWMNPAGCYPDIYDPATFGATFSLLKFRLREPTLHLVPDRDGWYLSKISIDGPDWYCGNLMWGMDSCSAPYLFESQQEAVAMSLANININNEIFH